jgi:hypothetical protein
MLMRASSLAAGEPRGYLRLALAEPPICVARGSRAGQLAGQSDLADQSGLAAVAYGHLLYSSVCCALAKLLSALNSAAGPGA